MTKRKINTLPLRAKIKLVLKNYLLTQLILMVVISLVVFTILTLLHIKYALLLAILTGALSVIPNYGMIISTLIIALVAIYDKSVFLSNYPPIIEGIVIVIILFLINKLSDTFLAPLLLGKTNKLNPFLIFFVVILGTLTFGILGAILAVPILLVVKTVWEHYRN